MNSEKRKDDLMKQGRGLATLSVWLIIFALVLGAVLLDICFVPSGELWEELKADAENSYMMEYLDEQGMKHGDKEIWGIIKTEMVEAEIVPIKSGFLCWQVLQTEWKKRSEREKEPAESMNQGLASEQDQATEPWDEQMTEQKAQAKRDAIVNARKAMDAFNEYLDEMEIYSYSIRSIDCYLHDGTVTFTCTDEWGDETEYLDDDKKDDFEVLEAKLLEAFPDVNEAAMKMYVGYYNCLAAAFSADVSNLFEGVDFPYINSYGHFDDEKPWGYEGMYSNNIIVGYYDEIGNIG